MPDQRAVEAAGDCDECGHIVTAHPTKTGAEWCAAPGCRCPFIQSDLLPMTPEQVAWVRAQRST